MALIFIIKQFNNIIKFKEKGAKIDIYRQTPDFLIKGMISCIMSNMSIGGIYDKS